VKILHLTTFVQGGAGRILADLAIAQRRDGHDVAVITSRTGAPGYGNYAVLLREMQKAGVRVLRVDSTFARDYARNLEVVHAIDALYPGGSAPDVIHAHAAIPSLVALVFSGARGRAIRVVQTMHGWGIAKTAAQASADVRIMNLVDRVAVPSRHAASQLSSLGVRRRIDVVPYGIAGARRRLAARDARVVARMRRARRQGALVLACVGTIGARKNQQLVVDAVARLDRRVQVFGVFVGDGEAGALRAAIRSARLGDRLHVCGYSTAARRIAAEADVFVLPSRSEGQPIAALEAFADGALVLVADIPELVELIGAGRAGIAFKAEDAASLARAITRVATMPAAARQTIVRTARARQQRHHTTEAMAQRYARLYDLAGHPLWCNLEGSKTRRFEADPL
jgi:glycosyltransferase involved in cell wall biosynthesis